MSDIIDWFGLKGAQCDAALTRGRDVVVTAGAGSGKTLTLVARYLSLLDEGLEPRQIVAVTFTEKAAREMRNRIRDRIDRWRSKGCHEADQARWQELEADIDAARIGTIHSLCSGLLRAHPAEAAIDPLVSVIDEGLAKAEQMKAIKDVLGRAAEQLHLKPLFDVFTVRELENVIASLLDSRLEVQPELNADKIATRWGKGILGAIDRFLHNEEVLGAIEQLRGLNDEGTLDAEAGDKMADQCRGLLAQWDDLLQARESANYVLGAKTLLSIRANCSALNVGRKTSRAKDAVKAWRACYDQQIKPWLGDKDGDAPDFETERQAIELVPLLGELFAQAVDIYQSSKDLHQVVDFDDLEAGAVLLLDNPEVRDRWQRQTAALLVDEFQDTNERQRKIVEALAGIQEGATGRLFVVGDAKQSIYRFRGADVAVFRRLDQAVRARGGQAIALDVTFRAHHPLLEGLNELLGQAMGNEDDSAGFHCVPFTPLVAARREPRSGIKPPFVTFLYGLGNDTDAARKSAARMLAQHLRRLNEDEGVKWDEIALLFRASAGFPPYEESLQDQGIPFVTVAGKGFYDRPEIRDILNILRALSDPWDDLAMAGLLRSPAFGLSDTALYRLRWHGIDAAASDPLSFRIALQGDLSYLSDRDRTQALRARKVIEHLSGLVDRITVAELIKTIMAETMYSAVLAAAKEGLRLQRNVDKLLEDAHSSGIVRVTEFLEYIETLRESGAREGEAPAEAGGAVRLMTVHKAKGLEFPVVVIADANRARPNPLASLLLSNEFGLIPAPRRLERKPLIFGLAKSSDDEQSDAEDLRVLYVAATRAQEKLIVCGHQAKRGGRTWLTLLAEAAGIDLKALATRPGECQSAKLLASHQEVTALAQDLSDDTSPGHEEDDAKSVKTRSANVALFEPLVPMIVADLDDETRETAFRIRNITGHHRHTDGTIVGRLVHEAIHRWRFPGDAGLEQLLTTVALSSGLAAKHDITNHVDRAVELLARLRREPRWVELAMARRYHEIPFGLLRDGRPNFGVIDLLYETNGGDKKEWNIIDFKTDHITSDEELQGLVESYRKQMLRYRHAVNRLLGGPVETTLCFLDCADTVTWVNVENDL